MRKRVWVSLGSFFTVAAFVLLIPTSADSPCLLAEPGIRSGRSAMVLSPASQGARARVESSYGKLPLSFEPNQGQTGERIKFLSHGRGYVLFLTSDEAILGLRSVARVSPGKGEKSGTDAQPSKTDILRMRLLGANQEAQVAGVDKLPGKSNYLIGKDPQKWRTNVPNYAKVRYQNVYPGIDLVYYGNQRQLEYDFVVAPGADPEAIALQIAGTKGSTSTSLAENGDLVIKTRGGEVRFHKPVVYQIENPESPKSKKKSVEGHFVLLAENQVGFDVGPYNPANPLYIDPTIIPIISYGTYLGGPGWDVANGIAVDSNGNAYVTGRVFDDQFPVTAAAYDTTCGTDSFCNFDGTYGYSDAFVAKVSADGSSLVYSTYLGGRWDENGVGIAVNSVGEAYVTGQSNSADFPTTDNAFQKTRGGVGCVPTPGANWECSDVFVTKIDASGSNLLYSTYLGGDMNDRPSLKGIAIDAAGNAYVAGLTRSSNFPVVNPIQPSFHGGTCGSGGGRPCGDAYVAKINPSAVGAASLLYSTYLGGSRDDLANSLALDGSGNVYVVGNTESEDFPITEGALQTALAGPGDAFVTKINAAGTAFVYSTLVGGSGGEGGASIAVDASGNAFATGVTSSSDFPTTNGAFDTSCGSDGQCNGSIDGYAIKLNAEGSDLVYSTFLGGSGNDVPNDIAVDSLGIAYVTGNTDSPDFPTRGRLDDSYDGGTCGMDPNTYPCADAFFTKLSSGGEGLIVSTYLGGSSDDNSNGIALDSSRDVYIAGMTGSPDFPATSGAFQEQNAGPPDAFVVKLYHLADHVEIISPESLDFSEQLVGTTSDVMSVTVKNVGDAATPVPPLDATGDFQMTHTCGSSIDPGTSCTMHVTFTPQETGVRTGALRTYDEESDEWYEFLPLKGVGIAAALSVSPSTLTFEDQLVETTSNAQTVTLTNTGTIPVNISGVHGSTHFANTHNCGTSLDPGKGCTINVTFAPKAAGLMTEQIRIHHDGAGSPNTITMTGKGTDFALQSGTGGSSASVTAGETATYNLSVNPTGYSGEVRMRCQWSRVVPSGTSCSFSPSIINLDGTNPANVVLHINTTSRSMAPVLRQPPPPGEGSYPVSHLVMWLLALAATVSLMVRRRRAAVTLASLLLLVTLWVACGGNAPAPFPVVGTRAGTYSLSAVGTTSIGPVTEYPVDVTRTIGLTLEVK